MSGGDISREENKRMVCKMDSDTQVFDALLALGFNVTVDDAGNITAERNQNVTTGKIEDGGRVVWIEPMGWALRDARIQDFKRRAQQHNPSNGSSGRGPKLF
jgi:hypothetical protein